MRARLTCLDGRPSANRTQPSHVPLDRRDPARASRIRTSAAMPQTRTPTLSRVRPSTHTSDPIARRSVGTKPTKPHTEPPLSTRSIPTALALLVGPPASISHILSCASDKTGTPPETSSARVLERWAAADRWHLEHASIPAPMGSLTSSFIPAGRLRNHPFPSRFIVSDRSSPSRVRFAASRPGLLRADPKDALLTRGRGGVGPCGRQRSDPATDRAGRVRSRPRGRLDEVVDAEVVLSRVLEDGEALAVLPLLLSPQKLSASLQS